MTLRHYQQECVEGVKRALKVHRRVLLQSPTGSGKCLGKGTPVLMYDGRVRPVEDIKQGDRLMGPDSRPRNVLSVCQGEEMLYRVTPVKGDAYVVNESHILSLRITGGAKLGKRKSGDVVNISVREYMKCSATFKHCAKGWRVGVDFEQHEPLSIDPYFFGLWLGDGHSNVTSVTTGDKEIADYVYAYADSLGLHVRTEAQKGNCEILHLGSTRLAGDNSLRNALKRYRVLNNKHIPLAYKTASRSDRLALLAGLVDSDGHQSENGGFDFTLKSKLLVDDIVFLARSLGFSCYPRACVKSCQTGVAGSYWRFAIHGALETIPTRLKRKQANPRRQVKNHLHTGIKVEPIGVGEYFGFEIDGDHLFLLGDFTVTHNTMQAAHMIRGCVNTGWRVMFLCHRDELVQQTSKTLLKMGVDHGFVAAGYPKDYSAQVLVCMVGTVGRRLEQLQAPNIIFTDEAHHSVAGTWKAIIERFPNALIVGLSATPERLDGRGLDDIFKALVPGPDVHWLMEEGYLADYKAWSHDVPDLSGVKRRGADYDASALAAAMGDSHLLGDAVDHYLRICPGERAVSFCVNVEHALAVRDAFRSSGVVAEELDGNTPKEERRRVLAAFKAGDVQVMTSVDLFGEGFDLPEVSVAILQRPTDSLGLYLQQVGRVLRPVYAEGWPQETREDRLAAIANGPKPHAFILDHAGNIARHGRPDDQREWRLEGRKKGGSNGSGPGAKVCANCFGSNPQGVTVCRYCGTVFILTPREIEQRDGELKEIERERAMAATAANPVNEAKTFEEIVTIFIARGHSDPATAAEGAWRGRGESYKVSDAEFLRACERVEKERGYKKGWAYFRARLRTTRMMGRKKAGAAA